MKMILLFLFTVSEVLALEAVVTVLETPMLKFPQLDAPVVQYLRKGDVIEIHSSFERETKYDHLAPSDYIPPMDLEEEFVPTVDRLGNIVYVIRNHLYLYLETPEELQQTQLSQDPTDYRLEEPLPQYYPIKTPTGIRGQVTFGFTTPSTESYPYPVKAKAKGYSSPVDFNLTLMRQSADPKRQRIFMGGNFNLRVHTNNYALFNGNQAQETAVKIGLGPYLSYDAYLDENNRIVLSLLINIYFFNQLNVLQKNELFVEQRNYRALNIAPRLGAQFQRKKFFYDMDLIMGPALEIAPGATFRAGTRANQPDWWVDQGVDRFTTRPEVSLSGFIGIQKSY
jgi:hypothetical protein